jgi:hypothetical protein
MKEMSPDTWPRIRGAYICKWCAENKERNGIAEFRLRIRKQWDFKNDSRKGNAFFTQEGKETYVLFYCYKTKVGQGGPIT